MALIRPGDYPADLDHRVTLPDGARVRIRPLRDGEDGPVLELYRRLSPLSRYQRFFLAPPALPDALLDLLINVDYRRRLALIAFSDDEGADVIGLGSFGAIDDRSAEVGLVIRDDWQRRRVGTELANRVLKAAEERGFDRFVGNILSGNQAIRRLLRSIAVVLSTTMSAGVTELVFVRRSCP